MQGRTQTGIVCSLVALALLVLAAPAAGSAEIGRLAPSPSASCAGTNSDSLEPTVAGGTGYVVPTLPGAFALEISSWSHNAAPTPPPGATAALTFKVFRKVGEPATYSAVAHDGPRTLQSGALNTFNTLIPVQAGDVIGINSSIPAYTACTFSDIGQSFLIRIPSNLADGESGDFVPGTPDRSVNVSAVVSPSSQIILGDTKFNKRKGTATLSVNVPNPGQLVASGAGVKSVPLNVVTPDVEQLVIRAKGKAKKKLKSTGKAKLTVDLTFTPTGGFANSTQVKLKLKKKH